MEIIASKIVDVDEVQEALSRAATCENRSGRFALETRMPRVSSSMMINVDYDDSASELDITFISGKTYRYINVPSDIYEGLLDAESKGEFFNENIKDAFQYSEVVSRSDR